MTTTSLGTKLGVRKITARIGAEITGVDPALELAPETVTAIRAALNEHKALVFRGVSLDDEGQRRFAGYFGPLTSAHPTVPAVDGAPNVLPVDSEDGPRQLLAHRRDVRAEPAAGQHAAQHHRPALRRGDADRQRRRRLPRPARTAACLRRQPVGGHTNDYDYAVPPESLNETERERRAIFLSTKYETAHPVARVHPLTGERGLFIGGFAQRIVGLSTGESKDILRLLQHYVTRPENILRVSWEPGRRSCSTTGSLSTMRSTTTTTRPGG